MAAISQRNKCIDAFLEGKFYRDSSAMWTNGATIFSYQMPLAIRHDNGEIEYLYEVGYKRSATTSYHMRALEARIPRS